MPSLFPCPYLQSDVELTDERLGHILQEHDDLAPYLGRLAEVLEEPDAVRQSGRDSRARLFSRWYDDVLHGKHVIVVVVADVAPEPRYWIITAYLAQTTSGGTIEWARS